MFSKWKSNRVRELQNQLALMEVELFQSQQFERIASDKLEVWVQKHDQLLIAYKELKAKYEPIISKKIPTRANKRGRKGRNHRA